MGLDQCAFAVDKKDVIDDFNYEYHNQVEIAYWRKNWSLNQFMINLYYMKGGVDGVNNCDFSVRITVNDLQKLKYDIMHKGLPSVYDLGSKRDNIMSYLRFIKDASKVIASGQEVYYSANW